MNVVNRKIARASPAYRKMLKRFTKGAKIASPGVEPFVVQKAANLYEWAMVYADRHPYPADADVALLHSATREGRQARVDMMNQDPLSRAFAEGLRQEVEAGTITPLVRGYIEPKPKTRQ